MDGLRTYAYNDEGIRIAKNDRGTLHTYQLNGTQIVSETWGIHTIFYVYDENGSIAGMRYRTSNYAEGVFDEYLFEKNLQGDVVAIYNASGIKLVSYTYDAWGKVTTAYHNGGVSTGARYNPFRYRGYYYDEDTGLYYLNSRYYDPATGRFISADSVIAGVGGSIPSYNMFAYCFNNPVNMIDGTGAWPEWLMRAIDWVINTLGFSASLGAVTTTNSSVTAKGPTIARKTIWGILSSAASVSLGYASGMIRGQGTKPSSDPIKIILGGFGKMSVLNFDLQNRIGTSNFGISKKDVLDIGVVTAQAGIQYKGGWGISLGAKASVASARGTYCIDLFGWKFEVGMNAQFLSYGYEFAYGALPDGGWGVQQGPTPGVFGFGYIIRITPN